MHRSVSRFHFGYVMGLTSVLEGDFLPSLAREVWLILETVSGGF